jgi:hypothetical protein
MIFGRRVSGLYIAGTYVENPHPYKGSFIRHIADRPIFAWLTKVPPLHGGGGPEK